MAPQRSRKTPADSTESVATQENGETDQESEASPSKAKKSSTPPDLIKQLKAFIKEEMGRQTEDLLEEMKLLNDKNRNDQLRSSGEDRAERKRNSQILNEVEAMKMEVMKLRKDIKNIFRIPSSEKATKSNLHTKQKKIRRRVPSNRGKPPAKRDEYSSTEEDSELEGEEISETEEESEETEVTSEDTGSETSLDEEYFKSDNYKPRPSKARASRKSDVKEEEPSTSTGDKVNRSRSKRMSFKPKKYVSSSEEDEEVDEENKEDEEEITPGKAKKHTKRKKLVTSSEDDGDSNKDENEGNEEKEEKDKRSSRKVQRSKKKIFSTKPQTKSPEGSPRTRGMRIRKNWNESESEDEEAAVDETAKTDNQGETPEVENNSENEAEGQKEVVVPEKGKGRGRKAQAKVTVKTPSTKNAKQKPVKGNASDSEETVESAFSNTRRSSRASTRTPNVKESNSNARQQPRRGAKSKCKETFLNPSESDASMASEETPTRKGRATRRTARQRNLTTAKKVSEPEQDAEVASEVSGSEASVKQPRGSRRLAKQTNVTTTKNMSEPGQEAEMASEVSESEASTRQSSRSRSGGRSSIKKLPTRASKKAKPIPSDHSDSDVSEVTKKGIHSRSSAKSTRTNAKKGKKSKSIYDTVKDGPSTSTEEYSDTDSQENSRIKTKTKLSLRQRNAKKRKESEKPEEKEEEPVEAERTEKADSTEEVQNDKELDINEENINQDDESVQGTVKTNLPLKMRIRISRMTDRAIENHKQPKDNMDEEVPSNRNRRAKKANISNKVSTENDIEEENSETVIGVIGLSDSMENNEIQGNDDIEKEDKEAKKKADTENPEFSSDSEKEDSADGSHKSLVWKSANGKEEESNIPDTPPKDWTKATARKSTGGLVPKKSKGRGRGRGGRPSKRAKTDHASDDSSGSE